MPTKRKAPGDETEPGARQSGENICPRCSGTGKIDGKACPECRGSGKVVVIVGDA